MSNERGAHLQAVPSDEIYWVDRGQPVIVYISFDRPDPEEVYFSYTRPGQEQPFVDDGFGQPQSRIRRVELEEGNERALPAGSYYVYTIDTDGANAGEGAWHFWAEWSTETLRFQYRKAHRRGHYGVLPFEPQTL